MDKKVVEVTDVTRRWVSERGTSNLKKTTYRTFSDGSYETTSHSCGIPIPGAAGNGQFAIDQGPGPSGSNSQQMPGIQGPYAASTSRGVHHHHSMQQHRNVPYAVASTSRMATPSTSMRYQNSPISEVPFDVNYHQPLPLPDVQLPSLQQYQHQSSYLHQSSSMVHPQLREQHDANFSQPQQHLAQNASAVAQPRLLSQQKYTACNITRQRTELHAGINQHYLQQQLNQSSHHLYQPSTSQQQQPYVYPQQLQDPYGGESSQAEPNGQHYSGQPQLPSSLYSQQHFNQQLGVNEQPPGLLPYRASNQQPLYPGIPSNSPKLTSRNVTLQAMIEEEYKKIMSRQQQLYPPNLVKTYIPQYAPHQAQPQLFSPDVTLNQPQVNAPETQSRPPEELDVEDDGDSADEEDCIEDEEEEEEDYDKNEDYVHCVVNQEEMAAVATAAAAAAAASYARATTSAATLSSAVSGPLSAIPVAAQQLGAEDRFIGPVFVGDAFAYQSFAENSSASGSHHVQLGEVLLPTPQVNPTHFSGAMQQNEKWDEEDDESEDDITPESQLHLLSDTENRNADINSCTVVHSEDAAVQSEFLNSCYLVSENQVIDLSVKNDNESKHNEKELGTCQSSSYDEDESDESVKNDEIGKENEDEVTPVKVSEKESEEVECIQTTGFVKLREIHCSKELQENESQDKSDLCVTKRLTENMPSTSNSLNVGDNHLFNIQDFGTSNISFGSLLPGGVIQGLPPLIPLNQFLEQQRSRSTVTAGESPNISAHKQKCSHPFVEQPEVPSIPQPTSQRNLNPLPIPGDEEGSDSDNISLDSLQQVEPPEGPSPLAELEESLEHSSSPDAASTQGNIDLAQSHCSRIETYPSVGSGESVGNSYSRTQVSQATQTTFSLFSDNFPPAVNSQSSSALMGQPGDSQHLTQRSLNVAYSPTQSSESDESEQPSPPIPSATTSNQSLPIPPQSNFSSNQSLPIPPQSNFSSNQSLPIPPHSNFSFSPSQTFSFTGQAGTSFRSIPSTSGQRRRRTFSQTPYTVVPPMASINPRPSGSQANYSAMPQGFSRNVPYPRDMFNPPIMPNYPYPSPPLPFSWQGFNPGIPPTWVGNLPIFPFQNNTSQNQNNDTGQRRSQNPRDFFYHPYNR